MRLRLAFPSDLDALRAVYEDSVRSLGPEHYSPEQVEAWASFVGELDRFRARTVEVWTVVAEDGSGLLGFATLEPGGELGLLFVRSDRSRRGIGSALLEAVLAEARDRGVPLLETTASELSRPLFLRHGFRDLGMERVTRRGASFVRYVMGREP